MDTKPITIAYGGTLAAHPSINYSGWKKLTQKIRSFFWTYSSDLIDQTTRSAHTLINAIEILDSKGKITPSQLLIEFWGDIDPFYHSDIENKKISQYFEIRGYLSKSETEKRLSQADLLFLPLESSRKGQKPLFIPGKLFEYIKMNKPIILLAEQNSDCAQIAQKSGLAITSSPTNPQVLADDLESLIRNKHLIKEKKINSEFTKTLSYKYKTKELAEVFNSLLK